MGKPILKVEVGISMGSNLLSLYVSIVVLVLYLKLDDKMLPTLTLLSPKTLLIFYVLKFSIYLLKIYAF